jgi:RNA polymerase sigma-70 factor (ECF subfamily)
MNGGPAEMNDVLVRLRAAVHRGRDRLATDAELLGAFVDRRDEAAFEALLDRHGPTVLGVCRRIAGAGPDAEDAFQAAFLVLARKAHVVRPRAALAGWLHGVAVRAALKVRSNEARRRTKEREAATMPRPADVEAPCPDTVAALHRELGRLPDDLRATVVLCDLEGKTRTEAARQLGWPEGTVASRLARARRRLARRLAPPAPALALALVPAAVPARLYANTLNAARAFAGGSAPTAAGVALAEEVITDMLLTKLTRATAVVLAVVAAAGVGLGVATAPMGAAPAGKPPSGSDDLAAALKTARPINVGILEQDELLTDLKCTPDQRRAVTDLIKQAQDEYREAIQASFKARLAPAGAAGGVVSFGSSSGGVKYDHAKLAATLRPDQLVRVRQLELHVRGPHAFADRRVIRALGLSAEQELKVEEIIIKYEPEFATALSELLRGGKDADARPLGELAAKYIADCQKVLTKEQRAAWEWLAGPRPEPGSWVRATAPSMPSLNLPGMINVPGGAGGGIRIAPVPGGVVVPPPPVVPPPVRVEPQPPPKG